MYRAVEVSLPNDVGARSTPDAAGSGVADRSVSLPNDVGARSTPDAAGSGVADRSVRAPERRWRLLNTGRRWPPLLWKEGS